MPVVEGKKPPAQGRTVAPDSAAERSLSCAMARDGSADTVLSVIVPARNAEATLACCLAALQADADDRTEIIVVDDGSNDSTGEIATNLGVRLLRCPASMGPGPARNHGARHAAGDVLVFVDADVELAVGGLALIERWFADDTGRAALFGSYDATPGETDAVSRYRNLLHHYVHQHGPDAPSHFWGGLGAIRRDVFFKVGAFNEESYARACEDIELGYRLRHHGFDIRLLKELQGKHLKRWPLAEMLRTDFGLRAAPWVRLLVERGRLPHDLSLSWGARFSLGLASAIALMLAGALVWPPALAVAGLLVLAFAAGNWSLLRFFARRHGPGFALCSAVLHFLHNLAAAAGALYGLGQALAAHMARPLPAPAGKT